MATLSGNKIKDTYQSLIKLTDNGNLTTGAKQLTDGFGNNSPLYISTTQIGIGVTPEATYDLHVYQNAKVGGNLTITGDLTVNGTTTTVDTDTLRVEDPLIEVARNNTSSDAVDIGIYGKYAPSGTTLYAGLFRDTGDDKFKLFKSLEEQPTTTVNTSGTGYAVATLVANVEGTLTGVIASTTTATTQSANDNSTKIATTAYVDTSAGNYLPLAGGTMSGNIAMGGNDISGGGTATFSSFVGDLTGNADTATALETARTIQVSGDVAGSASFDGTGDINISTTIQPNSVALGTDTTGNYVATISGTTNEIEVSGSGSETAAVTIGLPDDVTVTGELTVSGTGQSSFGGQVTIPATPSASTDAASKGYVDSQVGANNELSEVLANGNTTGGTDIAVSSGDDITFADNSKSIYGAGSDLEIYHNGTNSVIDNNTNNLVFNIAGKTIINSSSTDNELNLGHTTGNWFVKATNSNTLIIGSESNATNNITLDTSNGGSATFAGNVILGDTPQIQLGTDNDAQIDHTGSHLFIDNSVGNSYLRNTSTGSIIIRNSTGGDIQFDNEFAGNILFNTSNITRLTINSSGDATFAGTISSGDITIEDTNPNLTLSDTSTTNLIHEIKSASDKLQISADSNNVDAGTKIEFYTDGVERLEIEDDGQVNIISAGTVTNPCLTIGDDVNTGIWRPVSDTFAISTGGNERMRIDSSGSVGIGTSSPANTIHAKTDTDGNGITIQRNSTTAGTYGQLGFSASTNDAGTPNLWIRGYRGTAFTDNYMTFGTGSTSGSERMRIDSSGNIGIGITSPSRKLEVNGTSTFYDNMYISSSKQLQWEGGNYWTWRVSGTQFQIYRGDTTDVPFLVDTSGRVGIGTLSPDEKLDITGGYLKFNGGDYGLKGSASLTYNPVSDHYFQSSGSTKVTFKADGKVGVGITSPQKNLQIFQAEGGVGAKHATIRLGGYSTVGPDIAAYRVTGNSNDQGLIFSTYDATNGTVDTMTLTNAGNVGIGVTSPDNKLDIDSNYTNSVHIQGTGSYNLYSYHDSGGVGWATGSGTSYTNLIYMHPSTNSIRTYTNGSERMRIGSNGNIDFTANLLPTAENAYNIGSASLRWEDLYVDDGYIRNAYIDEYIYHNGDADTYIRVLPDEWIFRTGGSDRFTISSANTYFTNTNVGIGTTSPQTYLQIGDYPSNNIDITTYPDVPSEHMIHLTAPETTNRYGAGISFGENSFTAANITVQDAGGNGSLHMLFGTRHTSGIVQERMRITSGGDINCNGRVKVSGSNTDQYYFEGQRNGVGVTYRLYDNANNVYHDSWTSQVFRLNQNGGSGGNLIITGGNVGIGTSSPGAKLDIGGDARVGNVSSNTSTTNYETKLIVKGKNNYSDGTTWYGDYGQIILDANSNMTGSARKFMITNALNNNKFAIIRSVDATTDPVTDSTASGVNSGTADFVIDNTGNVGIGTSSPDFDLDVAGSIGIDDKIYHNGDHNTYISFTGDTQTFRTGGSDRVTINNTGVGIGVTNPSSKLTVNGLIELDESSGAHGFINTDGTNYEFDINRNPVTGAISDSAKGCARIAMRAEDGGAGSRIIFATAAANNTTATERMRIDKNGNVLMNCTSVPSGSGGGAAFETSGTLMRLKQSSPTTSTTKVQLYYNANGEVGSIHTSGSATAFNTSSDYRLKDDYKDFNGLDLVSNIPVYDFQWKKSGTRAYGVQAHELQEVLPQAVVGEKDGEDMQQVDYSKIVPILLKSIQELKQEIETLKTQINK